MVVDTVIETVRVLQTNNNNDHNNNSNNNNNNNMPNIVLISFIRLVWGE